MINKHDDFWTLEAAAAIIKAVNAANNGDAKDLAKFNNAINNAFVKIEEEKAK
tara:strand:- start:396 stop:554 length:159 start_codon:yes stop_codon:yes gene_type:complete